MRTLVILLAALFCCCGGNDRVEATLGGDAMGTTWKLAWRGSVSGNRLAEEIPDVLEKWENVLSHWRSDSDLSRFNRGEPATPELQQVIDLAEDIRQASGGAFDHRLLCETGEAGFGPGGSGIDLSAIGKGFAADRVGERLRELGVTDFVFELGGEILVGDAEWEVSIEKPDPALQEISRTVKLRNQALATSGNYRQFRPVTGGLAGHILDPRTRQPIVRPPSSVSVIAGDCATADAWATALFVLGSEVTTPDGLTVQWNQVDPSR
jgi:thiamine biosynthesis lipoprotein